MPQEKGWGRPRNPGRLESHKDAGAKSEGRLHRLTFENFGDTGDVLRVKNPLPSQRLEQRGPFAVRERGDVDARLEEF
jgi:hypothetical protein